MPKVPSDAPGPGDGGLVRRRQYRIASRLLKEYSARVYRITGHIGAYLDGQAAKAADGEAPWSVYIAVRRFLAVGQQVNELAKYASQMIIHYDLDTSESAELSLRMAEAEEAVREAALTLRVLAEKDEAFRTYATKAESWSDSEGGKGLRKLIKRK